VRDARELRRGVKGERRRGVLSGERARDLAESADRLFERVQGEIERSRALRRWSERILRSIARRAASSRNGPERPPERLAGRPAVSLDRAAGVAPRGRQGP
jgi:hypothetical protein